MMEAREIRLSKCYDEMTEDEMRCVVAWETEQYSPRVKELLSGGYTPSEICTFIYELFQDYMIAEETEANLYEIADKDDEIDCPAELYFESDLKRNPLKCTQENSAW